MLDHIKDMQKWIEGRIMISVRVSVYVRTWGIGWDGTIGSKLKSNTEIFTLRIREGLLMSLHKK